MSKSASMCRAADDRNLPDLPAVGGLPHLPAVQVRSFASENMQPVLDALPTFAPTPSVVDQAAVALTNVNTEVTNQANALAPRVQNVAEALAPVQALSSAVTSAVAEVLPPVSQPDGNPPALPPTPRNIVVQSSEEAPAPEVPALPDLPFPELPPQPAPLPTLGQPGPFDAAIAPAPAPIDASGVAGQQRANEALHILDRPVVSEPLPPAPAISVLESADTVTIRVPRPNEIFQSQPLPVLSAPQLPKPVQAAHSVATHTRKLTQAATTPAPAPVIEQVRSAMLLQLFNVIT